MKSPEKVLEDNNDNDFIIRNNNNINSVNVFDENEFKEITIEIKSISYSIDSSKQNEIEKQDVSQNPVRFTNHYSQTENIIGSLSEYKFEENAHLKKKLNYEQVIMIFFR